MQAELDTLLEAIRADYFAGDWREDMKQEFAEGIRFEEGRKYIRIITRNSVWGFVVATTEDKKFQYGDVLKAASWKTPARNFARGNIFDKSYMPVRWTGA